MKGRSWILHNDAGICTLRTFMNRGAIPSEDLVDNILHVLVSHVQPDNAAQTRLYTRVSDESNGPVRNALLVELLQSVLGNRRVVNRPAPIKGEKEAESVPSPEQEEVQRDVTTPTTLVDITPELEEEDLNDNEPQMSRVEERISIQDEPPQRQMRDESQSNYSNYQENDEDYQTRIKQLRGRIRGMRSKLRTGTESKSMTRHHRDHGHERIQTQMEPMDKEIKRLEDIIQVFKSDK